MYPESKNSLSIRMTEPVVPLRSPPQLTSRHHDNEMPLPAAVRGVLTLKLAKATKISSIELELHARATTHYLQSAGPSRIDVTERYKIHSASAIVFKAGPAPQERRRATSARPRVQFLDDHTRTSTRLGTPPNGVGSGHQQTLAEPAARSASLDPLWRSQLSTDPAPPYPCPAVPYSFLSVDPNPSGRSQSVASSSRSVEPPSSPISYRSSVSPPSIRTGALSRTSSIEEVPEDDSDSYSHTSATHPDSVAYYGLSRIATGSSGRSSDLDHRGRSRSRFSLGKVVHVFDAMKERVRSRSPRAGFGPGRDDQEERGRSLTKGKAKVGTYGVPQIEIAEPSVADDANESGDGWVMFPEGTYTYPVFFTIPNNSPPTLKAEHGSLTWKITAKVERPGAFKLNMTAEKEVIVISVPKEDDSDEMEGVDLQQNWEEQLNYRVQIAGRGVPVGGKIPFQLTLMPLAKVKVHSIVTYLDERTEYFTRTQSRARSDAIRRATLLVVRDSSSDHRHSVPIWPLVSDDVDVFRKSPLYRFLRPGEDESDVASSFIGPGPWTIHHQLSVPDSCSILHPSNQAKRSNVMVNHTLRLVLRVEKDEVVTTTGRKKLYDIVVHIPVQIFSCRCTSDWTSLPRYDEALRSEGSSPEDASTCPCHTRPQAKARTHPHSGATVSPALGRDMSSNSSGGRNTFSCDSLAGCTQLHERLISGMVSETGEAPPSYEHSGAIYS